MKKCAKCRVPLEGILSKISGIFGVKPSNKQQGICNKCEDKEGQKTTNENSNQTAQSK